MSRTLEEKFPEEELYWADVLLEGRTGEHSLSSTVGCHQVTGVRAVSGRSGDMAVSCRGQGWEG